MERINSAKLIDFHHFLLADRGRTESYQQAIAQTVRPGDVVLDIGTGTGILAFLACRAGAGRVYAIENSPVIELARQVCQRNGFHDRIVFLNDLSFNTSLPERVDVIVTETGAPCGLQGGVLGSIIDARTRLLKEHGRIIPQSIELFVAPVEAPEAYGVVDIWRTDLHGFDFSPIRSYAASNHYPVKLDSRTLLSDPISLARVPLSAAADTFVRGAGECVATKPGVLHGIVGWAITELLPGIAFSNSPLMPTVEWTHSFFPLDSPVVVDQDDRLSIALSTTDGKTWRWQVELVSHGDAGQSRIRKKWKFDQTTFRGFPLSKENLRRGAPEYKPQTSRKGEAEAYLLGAMDGRRTVAELTNELLEHFEDCFPSKTAAAEFVTTVAADCS
jgi:hypothetical protein